MTIDIVKTLPFDEAGVREIIRNYPTPFYLYDERGIRQNARRLNAAFGWCDGFKEYFAVKATPNPYILKIAKEEGFGADCSSLPELELAERVGITGENIMFTSNDTPFDGVPCERKRWARLSTSMTLRICGMSRSVRGDCRS